MPLKSAFLRQKSLTDDSSRAVMLFPSLQQHRRPFTTSSYATNCLKRAPNGSTSPPDLQKSQLNLVNNFRGVLIMLTYRQAMNEAGCVARLSKEYVLILKTKATWPCENIGHTALFWTALTPALILDCSADRNQSSLSVCQSHTFRLICCVHVVSCRMIR